MYHVEIYTLTSLQTRLIKTGGQLVRHARRLVFQLAEVLVTREMLTGILERISRLRLAPGLIWEIQAKSGHWIIGAPITCFQAGLPRRAAHP